MSIGGKQKESQGNGEYKKQVGLFEAKIVAINPTTEQ